MIFKDVDESVSTGADDFGKKMCWCGAERKKHQTSVAHN